MPQAQRVRARASGALCGEGAGSGAASLEPVVLRTLRTPLNRCLDSESAVLATRGELVVPLCTVLLTFGRQSEGRRERVEKRNERLGSQSRLPILCLAKAE